LSVGDSPKKILDRITGYSGYTGFNTYLVNPVILSKKIAPGDLSDRLPDRSARAERAAGKERESG
jgi:hypothetical protein